MQQSSSPSSRGQIQILCQHLCCDGVVRGTILLERSECGLFRILPTTLKQHLIHRPHILHSTLLRRKFAHPFNGPLDLGMERELVEKRPNLAVARIGKSEHLPHLRHSRSCHGLALTLFIQHLQEIDLLLATPAIHVTCRADTIITSLIPLCRKTARRIAQCVVVLVGHRGEPWLVQPRVPVHGSALLRELLAKHLLEKLTGDNLVSILLNVLLKEWHELI
mmetsp:Transcript_36627/g.79976  ORF Transcript_36627/g.79976 Transcript_36627/m.79976 type:complete len:221 (-) Transcript_36627:1300-1962(-)